MTTAAPCDPNVARIFEGAAGRVAQDDLADERVADPVVLAHELPIRLGPLTVEPQVLQVRHDDGRSERLEPRVMQVLVALLRARGKILSREDLAACCWEGRVVGDDALNRVISRLRRVAEGVGEGGFRIEAVSKVGFRLSQTHAGGEKRVTPRVSRRTGRVLAALGGLVALTLVAAGVRLLRQAPPHLPRLTLSPVRNLTPAAAPGAEQALHEDTLAAFGRSSSLELLADTGAALRGPLDFRLDASVRREGTAFRTAATLVRGPGGAVIWSAVLERPVIDPELASRQAGVYLAGVVRCTLAGAAAYRGDLGEGPLSDYAQYCADAGLPEPNVSRERENLRRAVADTPDFAQAWAALGMQAATQAAADAEPQKSDALAEASSAVDHALRLDPKLPLAHLARARLIPWQDADAQEKELVLATSGRASGFAAEQAAYAAFLLRVGRGRAALAQAQRGYDIDPTDYEAAMRLVEALNATGLEREADLLAVKVDALWPDAAMMRVDRLAMALSNGRYDEAIVSLNSGAYETAVRALKPGTHRTPAFRQAAVQVFEALRANAPDRRAAAAETLMRLASDNAELDPFEPVALAALGYDGGALLATQRLAAAWGASTTNLLFLPPLARARSLPQAGAVFDRLGLIAYWRGPDRSPDFCSEAAPPSLCASLSKR